MSAIDNSSHGFVVWPAKEEQMTEQQQSQQRHPVDHPSAPAADVRAYLDHLDRMRDRHLQDMGRRGGR